MRAARTPRTRRLAALLVSLVVLAACATSRSSPPVVDPGGATSGPPASRGAGSQAVGFDLDDTLLFSSPAFDAAQAQGLVRHSDEYWRAVNSSDARLSTVKQKTLAILREHQGAGARVFVVTARHPVGVEPLLDFIMATFGVPGDHVFFETEGKAARIRALGLAVYYGDSDRDMEAAVEAGARPVRILRSERSSYRRAYQPGRFGEEVIPGSEE